jgi:hypothetical protein
VKVRDKVAPAPKAKFASETARPTAPHETTTLPSPVRGWIQNENLAAAQPGGALRLDNWFPTQNGIRLRGGCSKHATLSSTLPVVSFFSYVTSVTEELYAATESAVYDVTDPADATVIPTPVVSGQTSGYYVSTQFTTAGGEYLYACNGSNDPLLYDGTTWVSVDNASTPAITGVTTADLSFVWSFANRLFFIEKDSLRVWYLPVDSIGGAASSFSLEGVFRLGGSLMIGATWSLDAGDGLDDKCVFVSDQGEVAVYEGTNPSSAADWTKVGVYQITKPLGPKAVMVAGGDLLIATETGIVPMTEAIRKDTAALTLSAITRTIAPDWFDEVERRRQYNWELLKWPAKSILFVTLPRPGSSVDAYSFVANLDTGSWCRYVGWDARCVGGLGDRAFYGATDGCVYEMEVTGADAGTPYTAIYVGQFEHLGAPEVNKTVAQGRAVFRSSATFDYQLSASSNYRVRLPAAPNSAVDDSVALWDSAVWDSSVWQGTGYDLVSGIWTAIGQSGYTIAPQVQITSAGTSALKVELLSVGLAYSNNAVVT